VSIKKLQAVHALTHPTAKLVQREPAIVEPQPEPEGPAIAKATANIDELFSRLAAEDDEETAQNEHASRHSG
jgi:hypothetical protein